jgi:hypothetical protein
MGCSLIERHIAEELHKTKEPRTIGLGPHMLEQRMIGCSLVEQNKAEELHRMELCTIGWGSHKMEEQSTIG